MSFWLTPPGSRSELGQGTQDTSSTDHEPSLSSHSSQGSCFHRTQTRGHTGNTWLTGNCPGCKAGTDGDWTFRSLLPQEKSRRMRSGKALMRTKIEAEDVFVCSVLVCFLKVRRH